MEIMSIELIAKFFIALIMVIINFIIWFNYNNDRIKWKKIRTIIFIVITAIVTLINYFNVNNLFKIINMTLVFIIIYKLYFKQKLKKSIILPILVQMIFFISEVIVSIIVISLLKNQIKIYVENFAGSIMMNISISLLALAISKISIFKKLYIYLNEKTDNFEEIYILIFSMVIILFYNLFGLIVFYNLNQKYILLMSVFLSAIFLGLIILYFKTKEDYYKINDKYDNSLTTLNELENVLSNYRIDNHENKNHLLTIKSMTKNKKVIAFIDSILDSKLKDSSRIMSETSIIPTGGLRGLIYSKLLLMDSKDIEYELEVEKSIRIVNLLDYGNDTMLDVCKIIGIFLDNAIEEIDSYEDKYIIIEMYKKDNKIIISITNPINHDIEKDKISHAGYSTKGGKHGYGLSLVDKLVKANSKLKTYPEISEEEFTQILEIYK